MKHNVCVQVRRAGAHLPAGGQGLGAVGRGAALHQDQEQRLPAALPLRQGHRTGQGERRLHIVPRYLFKIISFYCLHPVVMTIMLNS